MKYKIIYIDPPWRTNFQNRKNLSTTAQSKLYPTMSSKDILELSIGDIADKDCILFLWVINSEIPLGLECIKKWGFSYKTVAFTWVKTTKNTYHFGGGNWTRSNPELCLLATKGNIKRQSKSVRNLTISPLREHSQKPLEIRDRIVKLVGNLPRIEIFARSITEGWDSIGNQIDGKDIKESLCSIINDNKVAGKI
jgi:N6-adenosine-specific RNA methylase IME4